MRDKIRPCWLISVVVLAGYLTAQGAGPTSPPTESRPSPEMKRLAGALVGDWNTVEIMERSESFPHGASRRGVVHARLAAGGTTLIYEVHSNGSAGKLDGMVIIWWDQAGSFYRFFVCFNDRNQSCRMRGTARWEGDSFVNHYQEMIAGKRTPCRDSFQFTPTSHILVASMELGDGTWKTVITTRATRQHRLER